MQAARMKSPITSSLLHVDKNRWGIVLVVGRLTSSPVFFALRSAQMSTTMSGESVAGTRIANIPSVLCDHQHSKWMKSEIENLTSPSPITPQIQASRNLGPNERVDNERKRYKTRDKATPFETGNVGDDDLSEQLQASVAAIG